MESDVEASRYINNLYHLIKVLFCFRNSAEIIGCIMESSKISELFKHYGFIQPKDHYTLYILSSNLACGIIKRVKANNQLEAIIKDTLEAIIKKKAITFDLSQERAFAIALYKYFGFQIPDKEYLMGMLCGFLPEFKS